MTGTAQQKFDANFLLSSCLNPIQKLKKERQQKLRKIADDPAERLGRVPGAISLMLFGRTGASLCWFPTVTV